MYVCFKRGGEIAGLGRIGGEKWCRRGDYVGRVWGWMGQGRGNGWRGRVTFFRVLGREWIGFGARGCGRGVRWGARGKLAKQYGERMAIAVGSELGAGAGCWRGRRFWAHLVI